MSSVAMRTCRRMPPLNPLRAFEAAARHLSFTHAADELCVTQGAISRSVKVLEDYLGETLFERTGHGLMLTERSEALAAKLSEGFMRIGDAADEFRGIQPEPILTIRTYTSFLFGFLIPYLPDFQLKHPDIRVQLVSATDNTELARDATDVRIRYGRGQWKNVDSTLLFCDALRPLCSPSLLDPAHGPYPVSALAGLTLLHQALRSADWPAWLTMAGAPDLIPHNELVFDEPAIVYQAAIAGQGLVMAQTAYFQREINAGLLCEPFEPVLRRTLGYYLTVPANRKDAPHIRAFKRWLTDTIAEQGLNPHNPTVATLLPPLPNQLTMPAISTMRLPTPSTQLVA